MVNVEGQKRATLRVGDVVNVEQVSLDGEVLSTEQMVVEEEGQPRDEIQVGKIWLNKTEFKLKPQGQ